MLTIPAIWSLIESVLIAVYGPDPVYSKLFQAITRISHQLVVTDFKVSVLHDILIAKVKDHFALKLFFSLFNYSSCSQIEESLDVWLNLPERFGINIVP